MAHAERGPAALSRRPRVLCVRAEGLALFDAERRQHPSHLHVGWIGVFVLDEADEHVERRAILRVEHVGGVAEALGNCIGLALPSLPSG